MRANCVRGCRGAGCRAACATSSARRRSSSATATARPSSRWCAATARACWRRSPRSCTRRACACMMRALRRSANVWKTSSSSPMNPAACSTVPGATHCRPRCRTASAQPRPETASECMPIQHEHLIDDAWERRGALAASDLETLKPALERILDALEDGSARVAEPDGDGGWRVHQWLKKAVLLYFRASANRVMDGGPMAAFDKVPLRFVDAGEGAFLAAGARVVPGALVRRGAHVAKDAVLMPSYVNIGARVGAGAMVDTWAPVG